MINAENEDEARCNPHGCPNTRNIQSDKLIPASQHKEAGIGSFPGIGFQHQYGAAVVGQSEQVAAQLRVLIDAKAV